MKNKIIKPVLLLAACFVMQMTGAMGMDAAAQAKQKPPAPAAKRTELPLDQQIDSLQEKISGVRKEVAKHLQKKLPKKVDGVESAEALQSLIQAKRAALDVAKAGVKRTYVRWGSNLAGYDKFYADQQTLEKEIPMLEAELPVITRYEREQRVKALEEELQRTRAADQEATQKAKAEEERQADLKRQADERRQKEDEDRLEREHQAALEVARKAEEKARAREALVKKAADFQKNDGAKKIQTVWKSHRAKQQDDALVANFLSLLGGKPAALTSNSREARLASWTTGSYNVFNQTHPDYTFVKARANADQYGGLFDLAVSYRAHNPLDSHADNNWILKAREMGADDLSAAVKLVRQCSAVLDGKDIDDEVSKAIDAMMADTLATGGRIGIDLHRQATRAEMEVMIPALRLSGQRALALAGNDVDAALAELARIYLNAAFKSEKGDTSSRVVGYPDDKLFNSHKAHCFIAATRGLGDIDDQLEAFNERLGQMGVSNVKATRAGYIDFDVAVR